MAAILDLPFLVTLSQFGWAASRALLDGLASGPGAWMFLSLACLSGVWAVLRPFTDADPYALVRHLAALLIAAMLLYAPVRVDLVSTDGPAAAAGFASYDSAHGAALLPTHWADQLGLALERTIQSILIGAGQQALPLLADALQQASADPAAAQDPQTLLNQASWRVLLAALLLAEPDFAAQLDAQGLREQAFNPSSGNPHYAGPQAQASQQVRQLLGQVQQHSPAQIACRNRILLAQLGARYRAIGWTSAADCAGADPGELIFPAISPRTQAHMVASPPAPAPGRGAGGGAADTLAQTQRERAAAILGALFSAHQSDLGGAGRSGWADVYQAVGAGTLVSVAAQLGSQDSYRRLLGNSCIARGDTRCSLAFATSSAAVELTANSGDHNTGGASWSEALLSWLSGQTPGQGPIALIAAAIAEIGSLVIKLFAQMSASLTPYALALARGLAVILAIPGVYLMLVPGRFRDACGWLVGPMVWVHLWTVLFLIWYPFETIATDAAAALPYLESPSAVMAAHGVVRFAFATGYLSLPIIAWRITFGGLGRITPRMGLDRLMAPARNYLATQIRRLAPRAPAVSRTRSRTSATGARGAGRSGRSAGARMPANRVSKAKPVRARRKAGGTDQPTA